MAQAVFLTGYWRSGTNGTVSALGKHPDISIYNENSTQAFENWRLKNLNIIQNICDREAHKIALFKPVCEPYRIEDFLNLGERFDPHVIYLYREPEKVCKSGLKNFPNWPTVQRKFLKDFFNSKDVFSQYNISITNKIRAELNSIYSTELDDNSIIVLRWIISNKFFIENLFAHHPKIFTISYEMLTEYSEFAFEQICSFLKIKFDSQLIEDIRPSKRHKFDIQLNKKVKQAAYSCYRDLNRMASVSI